MRRVRERLAAQFGFALERREGGESGLIVLLGRDAAREAALQAQGMILDLALVLALADPAPPRCTAAGRTGATAVSLSEAGRAIAAGRLDQARQCSTWRSPPAPGASRSIGLLADLSFARGEI